MKETKPITASEMGQKGYKARLKKLGGKKAYSKAMSKAVNKRWAKYVKKTLKNKSPIERLVKTKKLCLICSNELKKKDGFKFCLNCMPFHSMEGREVVRDKIRARDKWTCQKCGKKWKKGIRRLDTHHKDCDKEKTKQYDNYEKEKNNLITYCHKCHMNLPEHKKAMTNGWNLTKA